MIKVLNEAKRVVDVKKRDSHLAITKSHRYGDQINLIRKKNSILIFVHLPKCCFIC